MPAPANPLPAKVAAALQRGNLIEAIKLLRDAKGGGLKAAKDAIDDYLRVKPATPALAVRPSMKAPSAVPPSVAQAIQAGNTIEAIKLMREQTGMGLKKAKDAVDGLRAQSQWSQGGSPGEVPRSSGAVWWVVIAVGAGAAYYFLRSGTWV